jgi:hypothetical protein
LAEPPEGFGARQGRAALASTPRGGSGRGEAALPRLGHAWRKAVGLEAPALDIAPAAGMPAAGLTWGGHRSLQAALDLEQGAPRARARAWGLGLAEGRRGSSGGRSPINANLSR